MKALKFSFLIVALVAVGIFSTCAPKVTKSRAVSLLQAAVFFTSDDAAQVASAAIIAVKYPNTTFYDIDGLDSTEISTIVLAIDTGTYHEIYLACDTSAAASVFVDNKMKGDWVRDELVDALHSGVYDEITPNTACELITATSALSKCEVIWAALYPDFTEPLVIEYLGFNAFSQSRGTSNTAYSDSTVSDNTKSWSSNQYVNSYVLLTGGVGVGQYRVIDSMITAKLYTVKHWEGTQPTEKYWVTRPTSTTTYIIKKAAESNEFFNDQYTKLYVLTYLYQLSSGTAMDGWHKLMDAENNINDGNVVRTPYQDIDYLQNTVLLKGKSIFDYSCL